MKMGRKRGGQRGGKWLLINAAMTVLANRDIDSEPEERKRERGQ